MEADICAFKLFSQFGLFDILTANIEDILLDVKVAIIYPVPGNIKIVLFNVNIVFIELPGFRETGVSSEEWLYGFIKNFHLKKIYQPLQLLLKP